MKSIYVSVTVPFTCRMQKIFHTSRGSVISQFILLIPSNFIDVNRKMLIRFVMELRGCNLDESGM